MAITWGSGSGSGNLFYVGIDVSVSGTTATVSLYVKSQYNVSDNQVLAWSGKASGSKSFYHSQSGGSATLVQTLTLTGANNESAYINASLSGVYNGASPSHRVSWTYPPPAIQAPNAPASVTATYVSDTTVDLSWPSSAVSGKPVDRYRVERYDWDNPSAGYVFQLNTTALSVRLTGHAANKRYAHRVSAENTAGSSAVTYASPNIYTTPNAPSSVVMTRQSDGSLYTSWVDRSNHNTTWDIAYSEGGGAYGGNISIPGTTNHTKTNPNQVVSHRARVRSVVPGGRTSAWVESNTLVLLTRPNLATNLSSGTFDPARAVPFSWKFNTVDGSSQSSYQLRWRKMGSTGAFTERTAVASSSTSITLPGGTWSDAGGTNGIEWQVRTKGQHVDWSDWSGSATNQWATTPVVSITAPGSVLATTDITVSWTSSKPQSQYRVTLVGLETKTVSGPASTTTMNTKSVTGGTYQVLVESRSQDGLWSDPASRSFTASYPLPKHVAVDVAWDVDHGWAVCSLRQLTTGGTATPDTVDLWRQDHPGADWELVAQNVPFPGTAVTDTEPAVDGRAIWVARSVNTSLGTTSDGPPATTQIGKKRGYLSGGAGFGTVAPLVWNPRTTFSVKRQRQVMQLDGGSRPRRVLVETPELTRQITFDGEVFATAELDAQSNLEKLGAADGPHLYRDPDGRKLYGSLEGIQDSRTARGRWWEAGFSLEETDHDAIVGEVFPA